jgi:hypothetical protein
MQRSINIEAKYFLLCFGFSSACAFMIFCSGDHTRCSKNLYSDKDMVSHNFEVQIGVARITYGKAKKYIQNLSRHT